MNQTTLLLVQLAAIGAIFYFLIIRPQGAARKRAEQMLSNIKKGDTVVTAGGIVGKVKDVKDALITIESGTSSLVVERARIVRVGDLAARHDPLMAIRDIHLLGAPVLRQRAEEVAEMNADLRTLIDDMFDTMAAASGIGLAANQIGIARRIAVVNAEGQTLTMINPRVVEADGRDAKEEGCLSIPEVYGEVSRPERVVLEALDEDFAPYRLEASGLVARAIQHEIDHLDGILFIDHLSPLKRQLLVSRYKKEHKGEPLTRTPTPGESEEEH